MVKKIEGKKCPAFKGDSTSGLMLSNKDFDGKNLVIYFYPKDSTPGCTAESCNLRDNYSELLDLGYDVLGVSADNSISHKKFIANNELPFHLLSDTEKEVIKSYDVWGPKKFMGKEYEGIHRTTFVIDENGVIERIFTKVKTKEHTAQILETYK